MEHGGIDKSQPCSFSIYPGAARSVSATQSITTETEEHMVVINLRIYYPVLYRHDVFCEVPEQIKLLLDELIRLVRI